MSTEWKTEPPTHRHVVLVKYRKRGGGLPVARSITAFFFDEEGRWYASDHDFRATPLDEGTVLGWRELPENDDASPVVTDQSLRSENDKLKSKLAGAESLLSAARPLCGFVCKLHTESVLHPLVRGYVAAWVLASNRENCYCSEYQSSGLPCLPGKCPNVPHSADRPVTMGELLNILNAVGGATGYGGMAHALIRTLADEVESRLKP